MERRLSSQTDKGDAHIGFMSDVLVLCYHAVSEDWPAALAVLPDRFEAQLQLLVDRGYEGATFTEAVTGARDGRTLAVTFDDGYGSLAERALPILSRLGLPGTVFVPTAFLHGSGPMTWAGVDHWVGGPHERELAPLSREQLDALVEAGWEVGSHSRSHPRLPELDDGDLEAELTASRADIEDTLGTPCRSVAYPYGHVNRRVAAAAARAGYEAGAALAAHELRLDPLRWPRVAVYRPDSPGYFGLKVSPLARRARLPLIRQLPRRRR
jgi:peptidoglycan/xylan/chitin deacetylase (PgdA/CDA1 family)